MDITQREDKVKVHIRHALGSTSGPRKTPDYRTHSLCRGPRSGFHCSLGPGLTVSCLLRLNPCLQADRRGDQAEVDSPPVPSSLHSNPLGYSGNLLDSHVQAPGREHSHLYPWKLRKWNVWMSHTLLIAKESWRSQHSDDGVSHRLCPPHTSS